MHRSSNKTEKGKDFKAVSVSSTSTKITPNKNNSKPKHLKQNKNKIDKLKFNQKLNVRHSIIKENKLKKLCELDREDEFSVNYRKFGLIEIKNLAKAGSKHRPNHSTLPYLVRTKFKLYNFSIDENSNEESSEELPRRNILSI